MNSRISSLRANDVRRRGGTLITLPVAHPTCRWQLDLFQFAHQRVYGDLSAAHAIIVNRHAVGDAEVMWPSAMPHTKVRPFFDYLPDIGLTAPTDMIATPINIQCGLAQVLPMFADEQVLEVVDCDMFHFRKSPVMHVPVGEMWVSTIYEYWHLDSLGINRDIIAPYFENDGEGYNGGFVPIIARADTFRRILQEWILVHLDILGRPVGSQIHWWAGMYALQAACEKARVRMVAKDYCYVPPANQLVEGHYIGHYCVDERFDKWFFPAKRPIVAEFDLTNDYYLSIKEWLDGVPDGAYQDSRS
jgi:hypothetical protein